MQQYTMPEGEHAALPNVPPGKRLSEVEAREVQWLSRGRLACGKLSTLDGPGGTGKSTIVADIIARITAGREPFGGEGKRAPANVILVAPEDDAADTLRPRLEAAGADLDRICLLNNGKGGTGLELPRDTEYVRDAIRDCRAVELFLDPIMSLLGEHVDSHKDQSVRAALRKLLQALDETGCGCTAVRHVPKSGSDKAALRGMGSVAFTNLSRVVLYLDKHPWDPDRLALSVSKVNIGTPAPTLSLELVHVTADIARVVWDPNPLPLGADAILAASLSPERREVVAVLAESGRPLPPATSRSRSATKRATITAPFGTSSPRCSAPAW